MSDLGKHGTAAKAAAKTRPATKSKAKTGKTKRTLYRTRDETEARNLVVRFLDPGGKVVVDRVVKDFGMSKGQLAQTAGLSREALYKEARLKAPKTQTRMREMLEIVSRVSDWAGGKDQAMAWYRAEPLPAFGGRTAESLVKEGQAGAVRDYLDHLALGGFA